MNWSEWWVFFHDDAQRISPNGSMWHTLQPWGHPDQAFAQADYAVEDTVEDAIAEFAATGQWPKLEPLESAMLYERLQFAVSMIEIVRFLEGTLAQPLNPLSKPEMIRWALVECWEHVGFGQIAGTLENLRSDDAPDKAALN